MDEALAKDSGTEMLDLINSLGPKPVVGMGPSSYTDDDEESNANDAESSGATDMVE